MTNSTAIPYLLHTTEDRAEAMEVITKAVSYDYSVKVRPVRNTSGRSRFCITIFCISDMWFNRIRTQIQDELGIVLA
jgi:hypothetical protein